MEKLYDRIDWSNNTTPAINETNLNAMSKAIDDIDDRVIEVAGEAVEASAYATAAENSASEAATYATNAYNYQTSASSSATTANSNMLTSEGYALGTRNGVAVSSDSHYYHNNSKYYCEHAFSTTPEGYEALVNKVDDILDMIADEWSSTKTYSYGMWLHYDGILYKVIASNTVFSAITPPNSTYYEEKSITDALDELSDAIGSEYSSMNGYSVGDIFRYEGNMYRVNVACTGITPPNTNYYTKTTLASLIKSNASDISSLNSNLTNGLLNYASVVQPSGTVKTVASFCQDCYALAKAGQRMFIGLGYSYGQVSDAHPSDTSGGEHHIYEFISFGGTGASNYSNVRVYCKNGTFEGRYDVSTSAIIWFTDVLTNKELTNYSTAISNTNLLDNPWFTVNQRGASSYTALGLTVDRWKLYNQNAVELTVNDDNSITLAYTTTSSGPSEFIQVLPNSDLIPLYGKNVTLSVMLSDRTVYSVTGTMPSEVPSSTTSYMNVTIASGFKADIIVNTAGRIVTRLYFPTGSSSASYTIKAVKLEVGSVSTLANDTAPNYSTELLKCQRYYYKLGYSGSSGKNSEHGIGLAVSTTRCVCYINLPVALRTNPTVTYTSGLVLQGGDDMTEIAVTSVGSTPFLSDWGNHGEACVTIFFDDSTGSLVKGTPYFVRTKDAIIELSADL